MVSFMNYVTLLVINSFGHPNPVIIFSKMKCAIFYALQSLTGKTFTQRVKYFIIVIIYGALFLHIDRLIIPTNSVSHFLNGSSAMNRKRGSSSLLEGFPILWKMS
jgi:hypothetical protein